MVCQDAIAAIEHGTDLLALPRISVFGGRHRFTVEPAPEAEGGTIKVRLHAEGPPIPIRPAVRWGLGQPIWGEETELGTNAVNAEWSVPAEMARKPYRVEIWDRNQILLLSSSDILEP